MRRRGGRNALTPANLSLKKKSRIKIKGSLSNGGGGCGCRGEQINHLSCRLCDLQF